MVNKNCVLIFIFGIHYKFYLLVQSFSIMMMIFYAYFDGFDINNNFCYYSFFLLMMIDTVSNDQIYHTYFYNNLFFFKPIKSLFPGCIF